MVNEYKNVYSRINSIKATIFLSNYNEGLKQEIYINVQEIYHRTCTAKTIRKFFQKIRVAKETIVSGMLLKISGIYLFLRFRNIMECVSESWIYPIRLYILF